MGTLNGNIRAKEGGRRLRRMWFDSVREISGRRDYQGRGVYIGPT